MNEPNLHLEIISKILTDISIYSKDETFNQYLQIVGVDPTKLLLPDTYTLEYKTESLKLVKMFFKYPKIYQSLSTYLTSKVSNLSFLSKFTTEQIKYITNPVISDTKLISCAGS